MLAVALVKPCLRGVFHRFWIVDNGSSHRGKTAIDRLAKRFPNAVMVNTPRRASWLNQASG